MQTRTIETELGTISLRESAGKGADVLLLHDISASKDVFHQQFDSEIAEKYHLIAVDLPGHGTSGNVKNPVQAYSVPGLAKAVAAVLRQLNIQSVAVFGWGLGGYIGLEMVNQKHPVNRLLISGALPISSGTDDLTAAYHNSDEISLAGLEQLTIDQTTRLAQAYVSSRRTPPDFLIDAIIRTDGRARRLLFETISAANAVDYKYLVETATQPIAVVNGTDDYFIRPDFLNTVLFKNLWEDTLFLLPQCGHAAFMENPVAFNRILSRFLGDEQAVPA